MRYERFLVCMQVDLSASDAFALVRGTMLAVKNVYDAGFVFADNKLANVLYRVERSGLVRLMLGDLGGMYPVFTELYRPTTYPHPWRDRDEFACDEELAVWGCVALFFQLFESRLIASGTAWSPLTYYKAVDCGNMTCTRPNLQSIMDEIRERIDWEDEQAHIVARFLSHMLVDDTGNVHSNNLRFDRCLRILDSHDQLTKQRRRRRSPSVPES